uniref:Dedicator of cytokinesis N-terminal domain-containing protein n=1 Tax=Monopterus albus TaxID=43700 RepID=A0A3Q3KGC2_MONAL
MYKRTSDTIASNDMAASEAKPVNVAKTAVPLEDPVVTEVTSMLQEWASLWKQLYVKHKVDLFYKVRHVMMELIDLRRQLLSGHLTQDQSRDVKRHITVRLDWGNE